jgi:hypothetical protein
MLRGEVSHIIREAEQLLWVLARCDVEDLSPTRPAVLLKLRDLEARAGSIDLYSAVLESSGSQQ